MDDARVTRSTGDTNEAAWATPDWTAPAPTPETARPVQPPAPAAPPVPPTPASAAGIAPNSGGLSYSMYKPGIIVLRPLNFGEILDGGIKALRHNPKVMLGLNALLVLVSQVALFGFGYAYFANSINFEPSPSDPFGLEGLPSLAIGTLIASLVLTSVTAVSAVSVGRSILGEVIPVADAWRTAVRRLPAVLGLTLLLEAAMVVGYAAIALLIVVAATASIVVGILLGILLVLGFLVLALWAGIKLSIAVPVAVLERSGPITSMKRSWSLTTGRYWPIFGVLIVATIITSVIQQVVSIPVAIFVPLATLSWGSDAEVLYVVLLAIASFIGSLLATVYIAGVTAVLYTDQRMRREGFDLALTRAAMDRAQG